MEMTLESTQDTEIEGLPVLRAPAPIAAEADLYRLVNAEPFQTRAGRPPSPSDITNLMFLGTAEQVDSICKAAGWSTAAQLNATSDSRCFVP
jgi:hypothetical protein